MAPTCCISFGRTKTGRGIFSSPSPSTGGGGGGATGISVDTANGKELSDGEVEEVFLLLAEQRTLWDWTGLSATINMTAGPFFLDLYMIPWVGARTFLFSSLSVMCALQRDIIRGTQLLYSRPKPSDISSSQHEALQAASPAPSLRRVSLPRILSEQWCLGVLIPSGWHSQ